MLDAPYSLSSAPACSLLVGWLAISSGKEVLESQTIRQFVSIRDIEKTQIAIATGQQRMVAEETNRSACLLAETGRQGLASAETVDSAGAQLNTLSTGLRHLVDEFKT